MGALSLHHGARLALEHEAHAKRALPGTKRALLKAHQPFDLLSAPSFFPFVLCLFLIFFLHPLFYSSHSVIWILLFAPPISITTVCSLLYFSDGLPETPSRAYTQGGIRLGFF